MNITDHPDNTKSFGDVLYRLDTARYEVPTAMNKLVNLTLERFADGDTGLESLRDVLEFAIRAVGSLNDDGFATVTITRRFVGRCDYRFKHNGITGDVGCPVSKIIEISNAISTPSGEPGIGRLNTDAYFNCIA